jgi:hypothetical protein
MMAEDVIKKSFIESLEYTQKVLRNASFILN